MANIQQVKEIIKESKEPQVRKEPVLLDLLRKQEKEIRRALPQQVDAERFIRVVVTEVKRNPELLKASQYSFLAAIMLSAQFGLEPGPLGQCFFIPYDNKKTGQLEVQFQLGYKGYLELVRRSGHVSMIDAHVVYKNDKFEYQYGLEPKLTHVPALKDRGEPIAAYAVARMKDGSFSFYVMSVEEIESIRQRSKRPNNGPWVTDWDAMARKTVLKQLCKYLPLSIEVQRAIATDETTKIAASTTYIDADELLLAPDETDWQEVEVTRNSTVTDSTEQ
ncbi:MAG TPA: recombination protein RecT [Fervidobacterium sp.]|nr:recombination protein RecT [Fervidobacterium sp.]